VRCRAVVLTIATTLACTAPALAQRSGCVPAAQPKELPTVSFLIDSGGALMELQAAHVLRDSMQFTLVMLPGDSIPVIHAIDSTNAMAANVLARSVWPEKPAELWAVRVHVTDGTAPALALSRATYCPPVLTPGSSPVRMMPEIREERVLIGNAADRRAVAEFPRVNATSSVPVIFEIAVDARGHVGTVTLIRASGSHVFDSLTAQRLGQQTYEPALLDGIPVPAVIRPGKNADKPLQPKP